MFSVSIHKTLIIFIISFFLYNCGGGGGGSGTSINYNSGPSSSGGTFLDSGTSATYNSTTASNHQAYDAYENARGTTQSSHQNPYDIINAYKAYGYGFSGDGVQIAIMDSGYDTNHYTYTGKTVSTYGTLTADNSNNDASDNHGNFVASIAAGYLDTSYSGDVASHGVAYDADLHLASNDQKGSETYYPDQWANALDDASNAVVQNNSWGFTNRQYSSGTSYTSANLASYSTNDTGLTANATSIDNYVTALNSFQDHGVIVFAVSNTSSYSEPDIQVAMPEIYSQLAEAWINVVNVDITGSAGNESYSRKSAPCGSTAKYCVAADGTYISGALSHTSGTSWFSRAGSTGSSFAAPQVSGAVAILAEAFPSNTPAQWTDRLLASADNSMCTASGNVSFANGITHAYCSDYGHGVIDIYAALRPITSSKMQESILVGTNTETAAVHNLNKSNFGNGLIFGDSVSNSFKGKKSYFHDALYGAFEYNFDNHLVSEKPKRITSLENSFDENKLTSFSTVVDNSEKKLNYSFVVDENNYMVPEEGISFSVSNNNYNLNTSYNYPLDINLGYVSSDDIDRFNNNKNILLPYISSKDDSYNMSTNIFKNKDSNISLGYMQTEEKFSLDKKGYVLSYVNHKKDNAILAGISTENGGFLDNKFSGAFSLDNNDHPTNFIGFRQNARLGNNELMFVSSYGSTKVTTSPNSLITNIDNVNTTSFSVNLSRKELLHKKDRIIFSISQPQRAENGKMTYLVPKLNDKDGTLNYNKYETNLKPSGRQIDFALDYIFNLNQNMNLSFQGKVIDDYSHIAKDGFDASLITSFKYKF